MGVQVLANDGHVQTEISHSEIRIHVLQGKIYVDFCTESRKFQ